jgi:DMSO/TMAO reductase YedYZ molybdopterin-dependent catalytic subunit
MELIVNRNTPLMGALIGALTAIPVMAVLYLGEQFAMLPFPPFDIFDWLARVLPGNIITIAIDAIVRIIQGFNLGDTSSNAKRLEQLMAGGLFIGIGAAMGLAVALLRKRIGLASPQTGFVVGVVAFLPLFFISASIGFGADLILSLAWLLLVFALWGWVLGWSIGGTAPDTETAIDGSRRTLLGRLVGGSVALSILGFFGGRMLSASAESSGAGQSLPTTQPVMPGSAGTLPASGDAVAPAIEIPSAEELAARFEAVRGTRDELTTNEAFYRIDINTRPIVIQESEWQLAVTGLFDSPRNFTLQELMVYPAVTQPVTMSCISNRVGGDLIGTSNWTGLPFGEFLKGLGIQPQATALLVEGADGFYETISREDFEDPRTLLVYGMNGETLPVEHGFPLRVYIPNRYGMKQPKWITRIEAITDPEPGYWVVRGWSQEARPQIVSVIDSVQPGEASNGTVPISAGGIAWAGDRGIVKVEVRVDDGDWQEAQLRNPTLSPLTWVQWRFEGETTSGDHTLWVRATDGTNTPQIEREQGVRPDGATGYHSRRVNV